MEAVAPQLAPLQSTSIQRHLHVIHAQQTKFVTLQLAYSLSVRLVNISMNHQLRAFVHHVRALITVKMVSTDKVLPALSLLKEDILQLLTVHLDTSAPPQLRQLAQQATTP